MNPFTVHQEIPAEYRRDYASPSNPEGLAD